MRERREFLPQQVIRNGLGLRADLSRTLSSERVGSRRTNTRFVILSEVRPQAERSRRTCCPSAAECCVLDPSTPRDSTSLRYGAQKRHASGRDDNVVAQ
jgi:hypothetical protein